MGDLHRAMNDLFDIPASADFVVVLYIAAHDAPLIQHILHPVHPLVAAAEEFAFLGDGRDSREQQNRDASLGCVVDRAT